MLFRSDSVKDVYPVAMAAGETIAAHVGEGEWYELSTLERYLEISLDFLSRDGRSLIMDEGCRIDASAVIDRSILWKRVEVGAGARVTESVLGDDVVVPPGAVIHRSVVVPAALVKCAERPEKASPGTIIGENLVVPFG